MLAIRLQRTGRSGHAQFRVIVQDSRFSPTRGRVVAYLGSYNPHTKTAEVDSEKASQYLQNGAQPSDRVAKLLKSQGVKLPDWVKLEEPRKRATRNPEKRRSTRPAEPEAPVAEEPAVEPAPEAAAETGAASEETAAEAPAEAAQTEESPAEPAPEPAAEAAASDEDAAPGEKSA
jgi:small subunit ribosomal protein S16